MGGQRMHQAFATLIAVRGWIEANTHPNLNPTLSYFFNEDWVEVWSEKDENCAWPHADLKHVVVLTYFKESGKYYTNGAYLTAWEHMYQIFDEVKRRQNAAFPAPGLSSNGSDYYILVEVPTHPHDHPHLVLRQPNTPKEVPDHA
jgi:hypothetical protein